MYNTIKNLCKARGISVSKMCAEVRISPTVMSELHTGRTKSLSTPTLKKIADYLGVDPSVILGEAQTKNAPSISDEAMSIATAYDKLTNKDRDAVLDLIKSLEQKYAPKTKVIPLFGQSMAAGSGEPDFGNLFWDDYEVAEESPAEFACRVHGDSLEPYYHDGDIALALKRQPMIGEVGAWLVDGEYKIKQYVSDVYGNVYLFALNRDRKDTDQILKRTEDHTLVCMGTLIMNPRPPMPEM